MNQSSNKYNLEERTADFAEKMNNETKLFLKSQKDLAGFALFFTKSNVCQKDSNNQEESSHITFIDKFIKLFKIHVLFSKKIAKNKNSIKETERTVKSKRETEVGMVTTATTERSTKNEEKTRSVFEEEITSFTTKRLQERENPVKLLKMFKEAKIVIKV